MKNLKALSFFSGAMGLDLGLKKAGIDIILACESYSSAPSAWHGREKSAKFSSARGRC